jgi:aminoglycoside 6'-N-acetyltransferase I
MEIRSARATDADEWLRMRVALWPDDADGHRGAIERYFSGHRHEPKEVLIAVDTPRTAIGFAELSLRNIVDSCATDRVGYLEGWYVDPAFRRQGVGRALVRAAEQWAVAEGCTEFASDSLIDNDVSRAGLVALGFEETGQVRNFRKNLPT